MASEVILDDGAPARSGPELFLGLEVSTQQAKAVVVDAELNITQEAFVAFDSSFPEFRTHGGVIVAGNEVTAPTVMWVKALDVLLDKLRVEGVNFENVRGISGTAQQHGTVYWKHGAEKMLASLNPAKFLHDELSNAFSIRNSPVWMDSSTTVQCRGFTEKIGSAERVTDITGSKATERYSGMQIKKIVQTKEDAYHATERISMISSFLASLFIGKYAPTDFSDGSGMNLLDIRKKDWDDQCLEAVAPGLREKLGQPVYSCASLGHVSSYFVERYGFPDDCQVIGFTGDNLSSMAGLCLQPGDVAVSLGTSDVVFAWLRDPKPILDGGVFCSAVDPDAYVGLVCFKNGSFTRERFRDKYAHGSWEQFSTLLEMTPRGNFGYLGMFWDQPEIVPPLLIGDYRFNKQDEPVLSFASPEGEIRALVEGQFLAKRLYLGKMGLEFGRGARVIATGGGSKNPELLQVLADVFNAPTYGVKDQASGNSACLGSAFRACFAVKCLGEAPEPELAGKSYLDFVGDRAPKLELAAQPSNDSEKIYGALVRRYEELEKRLMEESREN